MFKMYSIKDYRFRLCLYVISVTVIGILVIGSAREAVQDKQVLGLMLGLAAMLVLSLFDYSFLLKLAWPMYFGNIALLAAVILMGKGSHGATRWIEIAGIRFQPSELSKIVVILFFAYFFMRYQEQINTFRALAVTGVLIAIPLGLVLQSDLSTTIVTTLIFITLLFIAGINYKIIGRAAAVLIPAAIVVLYLIMQPDQTIIKGYQVNRILGWRYPQKYPDDAYQQQNSIMAIGSGQLWGKGLNNDNFDSVKNGNFISEPQTDFIFSVVGEELGFVGSAAVIILLMLISLECILIGRKAKDLAGRLICCGMAALVGFQSFVNISVTTGLLPNTGLPLPFVSYGLTSLVSLYIGIGIVLNVGLQPKKY